MTAPGIRGAELQRWLAAETLIRAQDAVRLMSVPWVAERCPAGVNDMQWVREASELYERATLVVDIYRNGVQRVR